MRLALVLQCALLVACTKENSSSDPSRADAASSAEASFVTDVSDASVTDEPGVPCMQDGSNFECPFPPPYCADAVHAIGYTSSTCVSGFCQWGVETFDCTRYDGGVCLPDAGVTTGTDAAGWLTDDFGCSVPAPAVPDPPMMACGPEAGAPTDVECPLPPSVCAGPNTIAYFDNGTCASGVCTWQKIYGRCPTTCVNGACLSLGTK
jgi:hypothetical protein